MLKHYNGVLGEFNYDDTCFMLKEQTTHTNKKFTYLAYIGKETDGSKIQLPNGLISAACTFENSKIITPPVIPDTVKVCHSMFNNCLFLKELPVLPPNVEDCSFMFISCTSLTKIKLSKQPTKEKSNISISCKSMFANCTKLLEITIDITDVILDCSTMFANCFALKKVNKLPDNIIDANEMFISCKHLKEFTYIPKQLREANSMFYQCTTLTSCVVEFPASLTHVHNMFGDCINLKYPPKELPSTIQESDNLFFFCRKLQYVPTIYCEINPYDFVENCNYVIRAATIWMSENKGHTFKEFINGNLNYIQHYDDSDLDIEKHLGTFDYDIREFEMCTRQVGKHLAYCGKQKFNGKKIKIPKTIKSTAYMFENTKLVIPPNIPKGVVDCTGMFKGCPFLLKAPFIPKSVKYANFMFSNCPSLLKTPLLTDGILDVHNIFHMCYNITIDDLFTLPTSTYQGKPFFGMGFNASESLLFFKNKNFDSEVVSKLFEENRGIPYCLLKNKL